MWATSSPWNFPSSSSSISPATRNGGSGKTSRSSRACGRNGNSDQPTRRRSPISFPNKPGSMAGASQGRASTNDLAARTKALFQADADLSAYYNHTLANGKWNHMMDKTHIGYTYWQEPRQNSMPSVKEIELPAAAEMGVAVEGSASAWSGAEGDPVLPAFDVFNP